MRQNNVGGYKLLSPSIVWAKFQSWKQQWWSLLLLPIVRKPTQPISISSTVSTIMYRYGNVSISWTVSETGEDIAPVNRSKWTTWKSTIYQWKTQHTHC